MQCFPAPRHHVPQDFGRELQSLAQHPQPKGALQHKQQQHSAMVLGSSSVHVKQEGSSGTTDLLQAPSSRLPSATQGKSASVPFAAKSTSFLSSAASVSPHNVALLFLTQFQGLSTSTLPSSSLSSSSASSCQAKVNAPPSASTPPSSSRSSSPTSASTIDAPLVCPRWSNCHIPGCNALLISQVCAFGVWSGGVLCFFLCEPATSLQCGSLLSSQSCDLGICVSLVIVFRSLFSHGPHVLSSPCCVLLASQADQNMHLEHHLCRQPWLRQVMPSRTLGVRSVA